MLQIKIIAVGKIKEKYLQDGIREYSKRIRGYSHLEISELGDEPCPERSSLAEEEKVRQREGEKILRVLRHQDYVILLDLKGK
ncbi:MAG: 23S rRNA (pseudouridine(1915)-N(3))-methyltransferase RlmH, partial [Eubacteriales bacterium]